MAQQSNEIAIFCCYAREDEKLLDELRAHLSSLQRQKVISVWHDGDISAGAEWELEVKEHLSNANIILLLISSDFIRSDYCYSTEMRHALERHQRREATVIPIILRPVHGWEKVPPGNIQLGQLQALPKDAEPVMGRSDREKAWKEVAGGIERAVNELSTRESAPSVKDSTPPEVLTPEKMSVAASDELNRVKREKSPKLDDSLSSDNGQWFVGRRNGGSCTFKGSWIFGAKAYYVETLNKDYLFYKGLHEYHRAINDLLLEVRMRIVKGNVMRRRRTVPNEKGREGLYLWRKDRTCENDSLTKAVELEKEAVFGRLEEP